MVMGRKTMIVRRESEDNGKTMKRKREAREGKKTS